MMLKDPSLRREREYQLKGALMCEIEIEQDKKLLENQETLGLGSCEMSNEKHIKVNFSESTFLTTWTKEEMTDQKRCFATTS